jgi:hypothetical protein
LVQLCQHSDLSIPLSALVFHIFIWARFLWQVSAEFTPPSGVTSQTVGSLEYGALANRYVREFNGKWLRGKAPMMAFRQHIS